MLRPVTVYYDVEFCKVKRYRMLIVKAERNIVTWRKFMHEYA